MVRRLGAGVLTLVVLAVIAVVALVPLLLVSQSSCGRGEGEEQRYSFVPPWDDPPARCRNHRQGFEVVADEIGL